MEAPKCCKCKSETKWLPDFKEEDTMAVPVMHYGEDDVWETVEDRTVSVYYSVSMCLNPACGELFLYDTMGGLGTITKEDYEERSGRKAE